MAQTTCVILTVDDRQRLAAIAPSPSNTSSAARTMLHSDDRSPILEVAKRAGASRPAVWRWQQRCAEKGIEGLLRDKTRPPGKSATPTDQVAKVLAVTCSEPPGETTHWTGRAVAALVGLSLRTVQRIWVAHRLQPHRVRTFERSNDPAFAEKEEIVGST